MLGRTVALLVFVVVSQIPLEVDAGLLFGRSNSPGNAIRRSFNTAAPLTVVYDQSTNVFVAYSGNRRAVIKRIGRQQAGYVVRQDDGRGDDGGGIIGNLIGLLPIGPGGGDDPDDGGGGLPLPIGP